LLTRLARFEIFFENRKDSEPVSRVKRNKIEQSHNLLLKMNIGNKFFKRSNIR